MRWGLTGATFGDGRPGECCAGLRAHRLESLGDVFGDLDPRAAVCQEREVEVKARRGVVLPLLGQRGDGRAGARASSLRVNEGEPGRGCPVGDRAEGRCARVLREPPGVGGGVLELVFAAAQARTGSQARR